MENTDIALATENIHLMWNNNLLEFKDTNDNIDYGVTLNDLLEAFSKFMEQKELDKPLNKRSL